MRSILLQIAALAGLLGAVHPASASLIGTTATTDTNILNFEVRPSDTATVTAGSLEFSYAVTGGGPVILTGDVEASSFTLTSLVDFLNGMIIMVTLNPTDAITGISSVITGWTGADTSSITLAGSLLTVDLSNATTIQTGDNVVVNFTFANVASVPEPASLTLLGAGLVGLVATRRRRSGA